MTDPNSSRHLYINFQPDYICIFAMKTGPVLITSFQTWRSDQRSNSSDDLIAELHALGKLPADAHWLRQVPVSFQRAPTQVIGEIDRLRPRLIICCGMAENRSYLSVERWAKRGDQALETSVNLSSLIADTTVTEISGDAGDYVCNHLYYYVLDFISRADWQMVGLFVHVPILSEENKRFILKDFGAIAEKMSRSSIMQSN